MKESFFYLLGINLLVLATALPSYAQDKILTVPVQSIETLQPILGPNTSRSDSAVTIRFYCKPTIDAADIIIVVDGKVTTLKALGTTLKPDSIKSICVLKQSDPEYAYYLQPGKKGVILVETHQASPKSSKKRQN